MFRWGKFRRADFRGAGRVGCPVAWSPRGVPTALYEKLAATFPAQPPRPPIEVLPGADPGYVRRYLRELADTSKLPAIWRDFWNYVRQDFVPECLDFWRRDIKEIYPHLSRERRFDIIRHGPRRHLLGLEGSQMWRPPRTYDPGLAPHTDGPATLIILMWYFRDPDDRSAGGNINFLVPDGQVWRGALHVPYAPNHLVTWVNTPAAIHEVTPRLAVAQHYRRSVSLALKLNAKGADLFPTVKAREVDGAAGVVPGHGLDLYGD